jgi:glycerol-3-phosphate dehydrogenase
MQDLADNWDLIVIGGGITGAGIFHETARSNLRVLLVEAHDFAWGTSSRSSKLIHGGLRYLKEGRIFLTRDAVREREHLLNSAPGLVEPLDFLVPVYKDRGPGKWTLEAGLSLYDLIAKKKRHRFYNPQEFIRQMPHIDQKGLVGGFEFMDARVDDARLVLRLIQEGQQAGGQACNYTRATAIHRDREGTVKGITIQDIESSQTRNITAPLVINATGCWAEELHACLPPNLTLRPLRGSHLILPASTLSIKKALSFIHSEDERAVFILPWEGATLVGTTDLDHTASLSVEPVITPDEIDYLLKGLRTIFPSLFITPEHCIATLAGIRPILSQGKREPSEESREHMIWVDKGLVTVTGGKLTTFRKLARDTLKAAKPFCDRITVPDPDTPLFDTFDRESQDRFGLSAETWNNLSGRYGETAIGIAANAPPGTLETVPGTRTLWAEIRHAAEHEQVRHLSDLLLRRVRIGLLTPMGAKKHLPRIQSICEEVLPWNRRQWRQEKRRYLENWRQAHGLPLKSAAARSKMGALMARLGRGVAKLVTG